MERRCRLFLAYFCIVVQEFRLCGGDEGAFRSPPRPLRCRHFWGYLRLCFSCCMGNRLCGGDQRAMKTDEVCDHYLETLGAATLGGQFTALLFVARGETSPIRSLYAINIIPKVCVSGKQSTVLRKDEHSTLFNQICYDFSAKRRKILLKNR